MEHHNRYDGIDPRVLRHIRATARHLARQHAVPGMDAQDFEQDLVLDLWCRMEAFDPARASLRTFAHRVIAHRVASLTSPTARRRAERAMLSLDAPLASEQDSAGEGGATLADTIPADPDGSPPDETIGLQQDVARFLAALSPALRRCCDVLTADNVASAAAMAGLHRSCVYESVRRLRQRAAAHGLHCYIGGPRHFVERAGT